jgi:PAS domain S-box-containing protein
MENKDKTKEELMIEVAEAGQQISDPQPLAVGQDHLQNQQSILTAILDIANEAIISIDESQRIILFNKGAEKIFGYSADEALGQPLDILLPERFVTRHQQHIQQFTKAAVMTRLMGERREEIYGRTKSGQEFPAEASISKIEQDGTRIFTVILRDITSRRQIEREREKLITELKALNEGARAITAELSVEQVLQTITHAAKALMKVRYVALGLHDGHGRMSRFITAGIDATDHAKIGPLPSGRGLLGLILHRGQSLIVNDISSHLSAVGFPEHHPIMHNLLGVPVFSKGNLVGALYLTDKEDGSDFTETDQQLVEMLALHAAIAIENARLYEQTERLAILEERERFARDLHDGIIQSIYAVGLALDQAKLDISPTNQAALSQIDVSLKSMARVIQDIRNYIFDLRPHALKYRGLTARLEGLIKELRVNTLLPIHVEISDDIERYLTEAQASHVFHICHEALANTARHARASQIWLQVIHKEDLITVHIEDNGIGFEYAPEVNPGHRGLTNIQSRALQLDANFNIDTAPRQGTRLTLTFRAR